MKIGIVNDLPIASEALRRAIAVKPEHEVIWTARDGGEAVALCRRQTPDLVLMDLLMPGMDGVEATRRIMTSTPCAILVVTASVGANAGRVFEAMGHGALDTVDTPSLASAAGSSAALLLSKIDRIGKLIGRSNGPGTTRQVNGTRPDSPQKRLVAIGASAGGPAALVKVLSALPADFPAAIVVVQHVDESFAAGMADWLRRQSRLRVRVAREGDRAEIGSVLVACTNDHLALKAHDRLGYTPDPSDYVYRPSVDVFFHSVCRYWRGEAVGVLLTGMGSDGAAGLKALRNKGCYTIAQDRASSAVYGMPKAAAKLNAAIDVLTLEQIAPKLLHLVCHGAASVEE